LGLSGSSPGYDGAAADVAKLLVATWPQTASIIVRMFCWNAVARAASICACAWRNDSLSPRERTDGRTSGSVSRPSRSRMPGAPGVPVGGVAGGGVTFRVVSLGSCARATGVAANNSTTAVASAAIRPAR
jgi:hypothetical protein